jgi:hypothetical protein
MQNPLRFSVATLANKAPAPNRRSRFPLAAFCRFAYSFSVPPASPAAAGEAQSQQ